jgi:hypothetical protein
MHLHNFNGEDRQRLSTVSHHLFLPKPTMETTFNQRALNFLHVHEGRKKKRHRRNNFPVNVGRRRRKGIRKQEEENLPSPCNNI